MFSKKIVVFTIITGVLINGSANAQESDKYLMVGLNKVGDPILLNTQEVEGTTFKLIAPYGSGISQTTINASCGESRLFITKLETYSKSGQQLTEDEISEEIPFNATSPGGIGMRFVCRKIGARGW
ncbi:MULTISPECIES: hypothetical protein [Nostoc]|uniref:Uncharacterized protein n=1 Tax=Nostoc paludosum FACHB-159 TaxID=2692908 RepID=A0ABR8KK84_9NOSO|nr:MULTISPECIES: hypothetical protein [Nostoc]MBD2683150.1 hypothetical protein [Nostoc sp. FACHB-857]MBD2739495.1 hypothetical protein [Nostoc paludosum FACHB-159]